MVQFSRLVAILDLIESPAIVVISGGGLAGGNRRFRDLLERQRLGSPDRVQDVFARNSCLRLLQEPRGQAPGRFHCELELVGGPRIPARVEVFDAESPGGRAALLVVLEISRSERETLLGTRNWRHDIAGPVTTILGQAELMLLNDALSPPVRKGLTQIRECCAQISDILARSRTSN